MERLRWRESGNEATDIVACEFKGQYSLQGRESGNESLLSCCKITQLINLPLPLPLPLPLLSPLSPSPSPSLTVVSGYVPSPGEIFFSQGTEDNVTSMSWHYREPRALTKLAFLPVPFSFTSEEDTPIDIKVIDY